MKHKTLLFSLLLMFGIHNGSVWAQSPDSASANSAPTGAVTPVPGTVDLEWTPPALAELSRQAAAKSSFSLDRTMLAAASSLVPESDKDARQAIGKIDGVSVHLLRFGPAGIPDEASVEPIREAYHQRGWKHLISTSSASKNPVHDKTTDLWMILDGINVHGAVILVETPRSLTLVTLKGDLSPVDLLHLRGHFGIPRFEADGFKDAPAKPE
jgi:hypothetical protein